MIEYRLPDGVSFFSSVTEGLAHDLAGVFDQDGSVTATAEKALVDALESALFRDAIMLAILTPQGTS